MTGSELPCALCWCYHLLCFFGWSQLLLAPLGFFNYKTRHSSRYISVSRASTLSMLMIKPFFHLPVYTSLYPSIQYFLYNHV